MSKKIISTILITFLLTGCMTTQYERGVSSNLVNYLYPKGQLKSHKNDQLPVLEMPLRVGIALVPESRSDSRFSLTEVEKLNLLESVAVRFKADKSISHIEVIPELYLKQGRGFITIEQIAGMYDIDVIALVSYDQVAINELNNLSLAYWTIVGAYIIPGESTEFQTFVDTAVFDINTRKMLFRAPGVHSDSRYHTAVGFEKKNREMRIESFDVAANKMIDNLTVELSKFKKRVKEEGIAKVTFRKGVSYGGGGLGWLGVIFLLLLLRFTRIRK